MNGSREPSRTLAGALLFLVAALGLLGGVLLDRAVLRPQGARAEWGPESALHGPPSRPIRASLGERIVNRMAEEFDLSTVQREQLESLLERQHDRLAAAMAETRPRLDRILQETHREIDAILTPEQRERFAEMWRAHH